MALPLDPKTWDKNAKQVTREARETSETPISEKTKPAPTTFRSAPRTLIQGEGEEYVYREQLADILETNYGFSKNFCIDIANQISFDELKQVVVNIENQISNSGIQTTRILELVKNGQLAPKGNDKKILKQKIFKESTNSELIELPVVKKYKDSRDGFVAILQAAGISKEDANRIALHTRVEKIQNEILNPERESKVDIFSLVDEINKHLADDEKILLDESALNQGIVATPVNVDENGKAVDDIVEIKIADINEYGEFINQRNWIEKLRNSEVEAEPVVFRGKTGKKSSKKEQQEPIIVAGEEFSDPVVFRRQPQDADNAVTLRSAQKTSSRKKKGETTSEKDEVKPVTLKTSKTSKTQTKSEKKYSDMSPEELSQELNRLSKQLNTRQKKVDDISANEQLDNRRDDELNEQIAILSDLSRTDNNTTALTHEEFGKIDANAIKLAYAVGASYEQVKLLLLEGDNGVKFDFEKILTKKANVTVKDVVNMFNNFIYRYNLSNEIVEGEPDYVELLALKKEQANDKILTNKNGEVSVEFGKYTDDFDDENKSTTLHDYFLQNTREQLYRLELEQNDLENSTYKRIKANQYVENTQKRIQQARMSQQDKAIGRMNFDNTLQSIIEKIRYKQNLTNDELMSSALRYALGRDIFDLCKDQIDGEEIKKAIEEFKKDPIKHKDKEVLNFVLQLDQAKTQQIMGDFAKDLQIFSEMRENSAKQKSKKATSSDVLTIEELKDYYENVDGARFALSEILEKVSSPKLDLNSMQHDDGGYRYKISIEKFKECLIRREIPRLIDKSDKRLQKIAKNSNELPDYSVYYRGVDDMFENCEAYYDRYRGYQGAFAQTNVGLKDVDSTTLSDEFYETLAKNMVIGVKNIIKHVQNGKLTGADSIIIAQLKMWTNANSKNFENAFIDELEKNKISPQFLYKLGFEQQTQNETVDKIETLTRGAIRENVNKKFGVIFDTVVSKNEGVSLFSLNNRRLKELDIQPAPCTETNNQQQIFDDLKDGIVALTSTLKNTKENQEIAEQGIKKIVQAREYLKDDVWKQEFVKVALSKLIQIDDENVVKTLELSDLVEISNAEHEKTKEEKAVEQKALENIFEIVGSLAVLDEVNIEKLARSVLESIKGDKTFNEEQIEIIKQSIVGVIENKLRDFSESYNTHKIAHDKKYGVLSGKDKVSRKKPVKTNEPAQEEIIDASAKDADEQEVNEIVAERSEGGGASRGR